MGRRIAVVGFRTLGYPIRVCPCSYTSGRYCCHIYLLDLYLSKLPVEAIIQDMFYMHPLVIIPALAEFLKNGLGPNSCSRMTTVICEEAEISGKKTITVYVAQLPLRYQDRSASEDYSRDHWT